MGARSGLCGALVVVLVATLAAGPAVGVGDVPCTANGEYELCLREVSLSADRLARGESATLSVTVYNAGDARATATVLLNTAGPDGETNSYRLRQRSLAPGETFTLSQRIDANTPGTHALQVLLYDGQLSHRYDASTAKSVVVRESGLGGALDAPEFALGALAGSLAVMGGLVYRRRA